MIINRLIKWLAYSNVGILENPILNIHFFLFSNRFTMDLKPKLQRGFTKEFLKKNTPPAGYINYLEIIFMVVKLFSIWF
jgi:hypothetical protein